MIRIRRFLVLAVLTVFATAGFAQDEEGFSGRAGLGYLSTTGNTETESLNVNFEMGWNYAPWHHRFAGLAVQSSTSSVTTAEAYGLNWQTDYDIDENAYWYGLIAWNKDEFSPYEQQIREAVGYGRRFIQTERHVLNVTVDNAVVRTREVNKVANDDPAVVAPLEDETPEETPEGQGRLL